MDPFAPKPNSTKIATKWAVIYAVTCIILTFAFQFLSIDVSSPVRYVSFLPLIAFLILAQNEFKAQLNGYITYGQAFSAGFRFALFGGIIMALFMFIYVSYINIEFIPQTMEAQRAKMVEKNMSDDQIEQAMKMTSKMMGPAMFSFFAAVGTAITGAIISLITAAIVKKNPPPFDGEAYVQPTDPTV